MVFGIKQKSETEILIGEKKCVERIGVRRGNSSPAAQLSLTSGRCSRQRRNQRLQSLAHVSLEILPFLHLVRGSRIGSLLAPDPPHSGTLWYWSVEELMPLAVI
jgi:hypothetical protein